MIRYAANLSMLFQEVEFLQRFSLAKAHGFDFVEFLFPYDYPLTEIKGQLERHELQVELFNLPPGNWEAGERGLAALPGRQNEFRDSVLPALEYALALGAKKLHCMAGLTQLPTQLTQEKWQSQNDIYLENLSYASEIFNKHNISLLIEPLNPISVPGYFLNNFSQAQDIIQKIENLYLQFDVFHCQKIHGNISWYIDKLAHIIKHYQIAGVPERHEPDTGELNYAYILGKIDGSGYDGAIGCEYLPADGTIAGLGWREKLNLESV